ncbi:MAG: zinc ribbon domain-containing protein [Synergistaceae bacterium]|jgi:predicted nucleic acid-binding Zn ribbon protein|nr:zinc ribbon domain-containing protein [Synergistaceae bacterium]
MSENETQICPKCGAPAKEGDVFCRGCGARHFDGTSEVKPAKEAERLCPNCGNALRPAARFCDLCGEECVKVRHVRRRGKRKNWCFLILAAVLLWLVAGVSAVAIYEASKDMSRKGILASIRDNFFAPAQEDKQVKEDKDEPDAGNGAVVSEDSREAAISYDSPPLAAPIAEDETDASPPAPRPNVEDEPDSPVSAEGNSPSGERDEERTDAAENTTSADGGALVLAAPLSASSESEDETVSVSDERQGSEQRDSGAWTEQDSEGYSTVSASDRFFTSAQTPSLRGTVTADHVRVRSAPNTNARIKRQLDRGAEVELVRRFSSGNDGYYWFEARDAGGSGWIYGEYIKPETGSGRITPASSSGADAGEPGDPTAETVIVTSPRQ